MTMQALCCGTCEMIIKLHYESATGHLERTLAVRPGHGCEKG